MDKYIGKVVLLELPNIKQPRYRWIVRKREDGRYIIRTPKIGTLRQDLDLKRDKDFGKEVLLPINSKIHKYQKQKQKNKLKNIFFLIKKLL
jgi:uncharacterized C2H2 Zn-finger protein